MKGEHDHLSSYAGRDQLNKACRTMGGFTGGSVKFRHKVGDWKLDLSTPVLIGEGSAVEELECMKAD